MAAAAQDVPGVCSVMSSADVRRACSAFRRVAGEAGVSGVDLTLAETAVSEIAQNMLVHGGGGEMRLSVVHRDSRTGVKVVACDSGPGIGDVDRAMHDGFSTGDGLGLGLPGAQRLMDEFAVVATPGGGTTVTMVKWVRPL